MTDDPTMDHLVPGRHRRWRRALWGVPLRMVLRWLAGHAGRNPAGAATTSRAAALRHGGAVAAVAGGVAGAAAALPPTRGGWQHNVNQALTVLLIFVATVSSARVVAGLVRSVTLSCSGVAGSATIFVNITRILVLAIGFLVMLQSLGISIAPLLTALGVGGLAVALALQDTLANLSRACTSWRRRPCSRVTTSS